MPPARSGVAPFAVIRLLNAEWLAAVIDIVIVTGFVVLGTYVYRTRQVRFASFVLAALCATGVVSTVYLNGVQQVYWAYPALMAVFYLIRPREAVVFALVIIGALIPPMLEAGQSMQTTTLMITIVVMSAFAFAFSTITNRQRAQLIKLATKDPLTGAGNRRALETKISEIVANYDRKPVDASLIILDLDHFKTVNDIHGHAAGDKILQRITEIVNLRIRITDSLYRIGGEEFVVVIEGQHLDRASHLAEQLRTLVEANELVPDHSVTISLGVAQLLEGETGSDWMHRADAALYDAKRAGRNTTRIAD